MAFFTLLSPILWMGHVLLFASAPFGRSLDWAGQIRDDNVVTLSHASRVFWPHTLVGLACLGLLAATHPSALPYAFVLLGGLAFAIPLAVVTSRPGLGRALIRMRIARLPEEIATPPAMRALHLPALQR
jgi:membrane glycosyltransferase